MVDRLTLRLSRNTAAIFLMFVAILAYSSTPLFVAWGGIDSPFFFTGVWKMGQVIGCLLFLLARYNSLLFDQTVWRAIRRRILSPTMALWLIGFFDLAFFAWSTQFIDIASTTVLYQTWPIILIGLTAWLFRSERRYKRLTVRTYVLLALAFLGVVSIIASQVGGLSSFTVSSLPELGIGACLVILAAILVALGAFGYRWGVDLASELQENLNYTKESLETFGVVVGTLLCSLIASPLVASIGLPRGERLSPESFSYGVIGGVFVVIFGTITWRKANLITDRLSYNVMIYATPVISLAGLFAFSLVGEVIFGYLAFGAAAIAIANVAIYLEMDSGGASVERSSETTIPDLIAAGESGTVEFKSTLRMNLRTGERDQRMELAVLKTLAAFLNTNGGTLVIGVADTHAPVGIQKDGFQNEDRMNLHLRNIVSSRMGAVAMSRIHPSFDDYRNVRIMIVTCERSGQPVYVHEANNREKFYIRTGASTTELSISESNTYINDRF